MLVNRVRDEHAAFAQQRDDVGIGLKNVLAG